MMDLMVLAMWSDSTRVATFMFGNDVTGRSFSFLPGVNGGHHDISHHKNNDAQLDQYEKINRWHVEQYAWMLGRMKEIKEGSGTLLDHSMVLYGSGMGNSNQHDHEDLPVILIGGASGRLKGGRHLVLPPKTTMSNLLLAMLDKFGIRLEKFGDSTGMLEI